MALSEAADTLTAEILSAGYATHDKPFHTIERDGLSSYLFRLQTEGTAHALMDGRLVEVNPGDLLLYQPGDEYELRIDPQDTGVLRRSFDYFLFCRGSWIERWWAQTPRARIVHDPLEEGILPLWRQIVLERRKSTTGAASALLSDYLLRCLCLTIDRVSNEIHQRRHSTNAFVANRMKTYVEQHATSPITVSDVANHVGLSVSRTVHLFKESFGRTVMEFAVDVRLSVACERIRYGSMTLEQAAISAGFGSYSYFHRVFKARFGVSPRTYRSMHQ